MATSKFMIAMIVVIIFIKLLGVHFYLKTKNTKYDKKDKDDQ